VAYAEEVRQGKFRYFEHQLVQCSFPPRWHLNPFTGEATPNRRHWTEIGDFTNVDIKLIWELSRFAFVYALVRAAWRTGNEEYARIFWELVEDWRENNPPNWGANWKCGQEVALRVMAWCFGLYGFLHAHETSAERIFELSKMIAVSGERIEGNIHYALSQRNNHGISEAVGLWTIGLLFPEFRTAARWREKGRCLLEAQGKSLIYRDGAFSQHSFKYHRLMLHDYLWALRLGDLNGRPLSDGLKARVKKAAEFLHQLQDGHTGQVPAYGQNDGALILPLTNCDPLDFRPVVQTAQFYFTGKRCFEAGPWDEELLWLFGPASLSSPVADKPRHDLQAPEGGYYTLRSERGFLFVRCAVFRDRPGQADMLHVDLWWRGINIAMDSGTYSYNTAKPWNNPFAHTPYHNTVTVDGRDQMDRIGTFLWFPWLRGKVRCMKRSSVGHITYWEGSHDGYRRLSSSVNHRRGILRLGEESWLVMDQLKGSTLHRYRLNWLFPDIAYRWDEPQGLLTLSTEAGPYCIQMQPLDRKGVYCLICGDDTSPRGWRAPYYAAREPALSVELTVESREVIFWTLFSPDACSVAWAEDHMALKAPSWSVDLSLQTSEKTSLIRHVAFNGREKDQLEP
jgi:asparagine synthase (glutamine-hydrolysing)